MAKLCKTIPRSFCVTREVFKTLIGKIIAMLQALMDIEGYAKFTINKTSQKKNKIFQNQLFKQLLAYAYLKNANLIKI
jgi:hypothetical protein